MQGREDNCSLTARACAVRCSAQSNTAAAMCNLVMHEPQEDLHVTGSSLIKIDKDLAQDDTLSAVMQCQKSNR